MGFIDGLSAPSVNNIKMQRKMQEAAAERSAGGLNALKGIDDKAKIPKAAADFASLFIYQMMQEMRKTVPENSLFGGDSYAMDIFNSMMDEKIAGKVAERQSNGLTKMIAEYLEGALERAEEGQRDHKKEDLRAIDKRDRIIAGAAQPAPKGGLTAKVSKFDPIIESAAREVGLDPDLIRAVIAKESSGNPTAVSKSGAKGLMQLKDITAREMGVSDPMDPEQNIRGGAGYLKKMLLRYEGDLPTALAAYNAGPGTVQLYDGIPPYPETRNYVSAVMRMQRQFRQGEHI